MATTTIITTISSMRISRSTSMVAHPTTWLHKPQQQEHGSKSTSTSMVAHPSIIIIIIVSVVIINIIIMVLIIIIIIIIIAIFIIIIISVVIVTFASIFNFSFDIKITSMLEQLFQSKLGLALM